MYVFYRVCHMNICILIAVIQKATHSKKMRVICVPALYTLNFICKHHECRYTIYFLIRFKYLESVATLPLKGKGVVGWRVQNGDIFV